VRASPRWASIRLNLAACRLRVGPGDAEPWVIGSYDDPGGNQPLRQRLGGSELTIGQARTLGTGVGLLRGAPTCELRLGSARPFHLRIDTGASDVDLDLSGVPVRSLDLRAGAGKVNLRVDRPNPAEADDVILKVGAGSLETIGLGNLATAYLRVDSAAAGVGLDLTGELRRAMDVRVSAGMSAVRLTLPADRPAQVSTESTARGTDLGDGFVTRDGRYFTTAEGEPLITLHASVRFGSLQLRTATSPA